MKEKRVRFSNEQEEDRISSLSNDLIHKIMSFLDVSSAVQTTVLSKRWNLVWTTLPFLNFVKDGYMSTHFGINFVKSFFYHRGYGSKILKLDLAFQSPPPFWVDWFTTYAITHNVQELNYDISSAGTNDDVIEFSAFRSSTIKKLKLRLKFAKMAESERWDLPALTTLHLIGSAPFHSVLRDYKLPDSYLICLSSLRTLLLDGIVFHDSISLPDLTTLYLARCMVPQNLCDFRALLDLTMEDVWFYGSTSFFSALVNLRKLNLSFTTIIMLDLEIKCPQLVNLEISICTFFPKDCYIECPELKNLQINVFTSTTTSGKIWVLAPKIRNFSSVGIFPITFGVSELENVNIKLPKCVRLGTDASPMTLRKYYIQVLYMFPGLSSAKILTLDFETIEALCYVSDYLANFPSPFYNLKYVKVPKGYNILCISTYLKRYLLGRSPKVIIVTTLPQDELISQMLPPCSSLQNLFSEKSLLTPVARIGNYQESCSKGLNDYELWQGHEVNSEFLDLLNYITKKYPETFEHFTTNSKKLGTMKLNMLCTTIKAFSETSLTEVDTEMIAEYMAQFADLQRSFNIKWLVNHLNYIEQLHCSQPSFENLHAFDSRINDARSKLHDLQAL